jgi:hypothetical protein
VGSFETVGNMRKVPPAATLGQQGLGLALFSQSCDAPKLCPTSWAVVRTLFHVGTTPKMLSVVVKPVLSARYLASAQGI